MELRKANTSEPLNWTWAGERSEQPRSFQSPEMFFLLTLPFVERIYRSSEIGRKINRRMSGNPARDPK
jgi:hypothetical protein